jgi:hypothetical protein
MKRAMIAATVYFLMLFALGFALGAIRVLAVTPRIGELAATLTEVPLMLTAAFFASRWTITRWRVPRDPAARWAMVFWFLILLFLFETLLGAMLFGRAMAEQGAGLATPAGLVGISAQIIAALLPVFVRQGEVGDSDSMEDSVGEARE